MDTFIKKINNPLQFYLFTLVKLPSLWFWGLKVEDFDHSQCNIRIRYSWFTQNPFRSIYFSALSGAAELSTGLLVQHAALQHGNVSMLVVKAESFFLKKATGSIIFSCNQGNTVSVAFQNLTKPGDSSEIVLSSRGIDQSGVEVARFTFTWAIKKR